jgi:hypothetical protein
MNRILRQSLWVLALGVAFTGLSTTSLAAAVPAQQGQDQDRNQNPDRNEGQYQRANFQQGVQDGQHDRQYGGNRSDHQQPNDPNDLRAYEEGYRQGFRNTAPNQQEYRNAPLSFFEQGVRDGQHDRQFGGNRSDHSQPRSGRNLRSYRDGYKQGFRNTASTQQYDRRENVNYFEQGLRDGRSDRQNGGSRSDHQQPSDATDLQAYRDGYRQGYRNNG